MKDPEAKLREHDPLHYWEDPGGFEAKGLTDAYWNDPWPELQGMLTSEHIRAYHDAVGRMIRPFDSPRLKTASYELTLGARYLVENKEGLLSPAEPRLRLPPNSLAFVSMQQVLLLPHYLVGRFDLAIDFIYQGLLLGTGPQADPGFQGGLSCPLHNISNEEIVIELGEPFAKIDFAKTAPRPDSVRTAWQDVKTESELARWLEEQPANSSSRVFKGGRPEWRKPIFGYMGNKRPTSSVKELQRNVDKLRRYAWRGVAAALITILIAFPTLILQTTDLFTNNLAESSTVTALEQKYFSQNRSLHRQLSHLRRELGAVREEARISPTSQP
jgi:deoxycytidine triphosphate deaminase